MQPAGISQEVSVICTAKNAAATIERTIRSILAQDFQNWEMIVVDDGSTDDTASIVKKFAHSDPRIRLIATDGVGRGRALNLALAAANADLVANIDADDEWHPNFLACTVATLQARPAFALLSTAYLQLHGTEPTVWPEVAHAAEVADVTNLLARGNPIFHSSVVMRRDALLAVGDYREHLASNFDYDLWVRLAGAGHVLARLDLILAVKRIHPNQAFLHRRRLHYLAVSAAIQARAIRALNCGWRYLALIPLRILWGLLPVGMRLRLRPRRL